MDSQTLTRPARDTPVLLIIFKRPDLTRKVLRAIAQVRPRVLLVAADGPHSTAEDELCAATRAVIAEVDWDCDVRTLYSETNLGCGIRVFTAIDWAFTQCEQLIILEDDCVPIPSFFRFCEEMLDYYRDDKRVMHVSGNNFQPEAPLAGDSYYFSKYTHAWGWATWRRAWTYFDWSLAHWPELKTQDAIRSWCDDPYEQRYWTKIFDEMNGGAPDIWDYQWNFACWAQNGLAIVPTNNLVSNVGFGMDATHTKGLGPFSNLATSEIHNITHPRFLLRNYKADAYTFDTNYGGAAMKRNDSVTARVKSALRPLSLPYRAARRLWRFVRRLSESPGTRY